MSRYPPAEITKEDFLRVMQEASIDFDPSAWFEKRGMPSDLVDWYVQQSEYALAFNCLAGPQIAIRTAILAAFTIGWDMAAAQFNCVASANND